jgi:hypothetical protein
MDIEDDARAMTSSTEAPACTGIRLGTRRMRGSAGRDLASMRTQGIVDKPPGQKPVDQLRRGLAEVFASMSNRLGGDACRWKSSSFISLFLTYLIYQLMPGLDAPTLLHAQILQRLNPNQGLAIVIPQWSRLLDWGITVNYFSSSKANKLNVSNKLEIEAKSTSFKKFSAVK